MVDQATDFTLIVGKTIKRAFISKSFHSIILLFSDFTWFEMSHPVGIDEDIVFTHITGHQFLFDATVLSVDIIDSLDVSITTNTGITLFNSQLVQPNFINGILDIFPITNIQNYDDNTATTVVGIAESIKEISYDVLTFDF